VLLQAEIARSEPLTRSSSFTDVLLAGVTFSKSLL
jgi:hypothetical protein